MRATGLSGVAAVLLFCLFITTSAANAPLAGPQATAAQISSAHPAIQSATRLVFEKQRSGTAATVMTAIIADDYLDVTEGDNETIFDFKLRRAIAVDRNSRHFRNGSLYSTAAFRAFELTNRHVMLAALTAAKIATLPDNLKPFWVETELVIANPSQPPPQIERQTSASGAMSFRFDGTDVVRFEPGAQAIPTPERNRFSRALRYIVQIHPSILDDIAATGRVPATLVYTWFAGTATTTVTLTLRSAERFDAAFPLPANFAVEMLRPEPTDRLNTALSGILPLMSKAVAGQYAGGPKTVADYQAEIGDTVGNGAAFQAVLLEFELLLQHGQASIQCPTAPAVPRCYAMRELLALASGDPRTQSFVEALQFDATNRNRAIELRQGIARGDLKDTTALDIMLANALSQSQKHGDAIPFFLSAIRANPYVASFYKDLGDHFLRDYRTDLAWLCYDLGRALPEAYAAGTFQAVDQMEQQLASRNPPLF
jgi:hypothetical protein